MLSLNNGIRRISLDVGLFVNRNPKYIKYVYI